MNAPTTLQDLQREYRELVLGPLWLDELGRAARSVTISFPAHSYTETGAWNPVELENLVQEAVLTQLLEEGQLEYILDTAHDISSVRALLHHILRRTLARTRRRTVVDNLLGRAQELTPFSTSAEVAATTDAVLRAAATAVAKLPRIRIVQSERAPAVFTTATLRDALQIVEHHLGHRATRADLSRILELALTDYLPTGLVHSEGSGDEPDRDLNPEEELTVQDTLDVLLDLSDQTLTILALKIADRSDQDVATHLGVSRPTAAKRFREASAILNSAITTLDTRLQDMVLSRLADRLLEEHLPDLPTTEEIK